MNQTKLGEIMPISVPDTKILWGRAAGICSNPECGDDLTIILEGNRNYNIGEMAHIIDRSPNGISPRRLGEGGSDGYENLILLCPTCHTRIDRAPDGEYPADMLHEWKQRHEVKIRSQGTELRFSAFDDLRAKCKRLQKENKMLWSQYGPHSDAAQDPASNLYQVWNLRKLDTIIPNNQKMINMIEANEELINESQYEAYLLFKSHASAFERNQYGRLDTYPTFPEQFESEFG